MRSKTYCITCIFLPKLVLYLVCTVNGFQSYPKKIIHGGCNIRKRRSLTPLCPQVPRTVCGTVDYSHNLYSTLTLTQEDHSLSIQNSLDALDTLVITFSRWYEIWTEVLTRESQREIGGERPKYIIPLITSSDQDVCSQKMDSYITLFERHDGTFILEIDSSTKRKSHYTMLSDMHLLLDDITHMENMALLIRLDQYMASSSSTMQRFVVHLPNFIRHLAEVSFDHNAHVSDSSPDDVIPNDALIKDDGIIALKLLGLLSSRSMMFIDDNTKGKINQLPSSESLSKHDGNDSSKRGRNVIHPVSQLLDSFTIQSIQAILQDMKNAGLLSTNLDSVDALPSLHLNLISNGHALFKQPPQDGTVESNNVDFETNTARLVTLLEPFLYHTLLPLAKDVLQSSTLAISDVFIRNYGINVQHQYPPNGETTIVDSTGNSRLKLSPHFDVQSSATCVIALDNVSAEGNRGLYTMSHHSQLTSDSRKGQVLSHFGLRRFFPLALGDGVIHSWDILHGVQIDEDVQRASLIVWFTDTENRDSAKAADHIVHSPPHGKVIVPWLHNIEDSDDVAKVVLALAKESATFSDASTSDSMKLSTNNAVLGEDTEQHPYILYKESAAYGNSLALARLGTLCEEEKLSGLCSKLELYMLLKQLRPKCNDQRDMMFINPFLYKRSIDTVQDLSWSDISKACWFESAMRGNKLSQIALADACMLEYYSNQEPKESLLRMAATLFVLAYQQDGYDDVKTSISRLSKIELSRFRNNMDDDELDPDDFLSRPVMKILQCCSLI